MYRDRPNKKAAKRRRRITGVWLMEKYVVVKRHKLPIVKETDSVNNFVTELMSRNAGTFCVQTEADIIPVEGYIAYLSYGSSTKEVIDGMVVPNRAILEFGRPPNKAGIAGEIWNDEFIVVKRLRSGYTGLTNEEIMAAKRTFGKGSIIQAHSLGFPP